MKLQAILATTTLLMATAPARAADPAKLDEARSAIAEAAALSAAEASGRVTRAYSRTLASQLRQELTELAKDPDLGPIAGAALTAMSRRDQAGLERLRDRLVAMERAHGRAG